MRHYERISSLFAALCGALLLAAGPARAQTPDDDPPLKGREATPAKPDEAKPDEAKPDEAKPDEAEPDQAKPDEPEHDVGTPDWAKTDAPTDTAPADTEPADLLGAAPGDDQENLLEGGDDTNLLLGGDGDEDLEDITLEDPLVGYVVVTGSKRRQRTQDTLASISILTSEQIEAMPYFFLGDLLSALPGVDARWGMMQRYYVGIRGLGSTTALNSRLLLLWDGIPMNDPFTGELTAGHFIPLVDLERIEMIRGAGSSIYGANAFSGVVNIVTRDPAELAAAEGVRATALMGSFLTSRIQVAGDETNHGVHTGASVEAFRTDGPFPHIERATPDGFKEFKNDDVMSVATEAHLAYEGLQVRGQYTYGDRGKPGTMITDSTGHIRECENCHSSTEWGKGEKYPAIPHSCGNCHAAPNDRETVQRGGVAVLYNRWLGSGVKIAAQAYDNEYRTEYISVKETEFLTLREDHIDLKQRAAGGEVSFAHASKLNNAVLGAVVRHTAASSQMLVTPEMENDATISNVAGFLEDELAPTKWLALTAGGRVDYSTEFGASFSPRGGVHARLGERLTMRGTASRAFRNPSLSELFVEERRGKYTVSGNPDLDREWITAFEGGFDYAFEPADKLILRVGGVGYWNRTTALIGVEAVSRDQATFVNFEPVTIAGGEAEVDFELKTKPSVKAFLNYSYQHARDPDGEALPYAPTNKGNVTLLAHNGGWGALLRTRIVGPRWDEMKVKVKGYATLDASAQFTLGHGLVMQLWANNLAGDDSQESLGVPRAPRSFFVTLGYADFK